MIKKFLFFHVCIIIILFTNAAWCADKISGSACYTYGDNESLVQAEQMTKTLAIRNAIESYSIFIESTSTVRDFQLSSDLINTISTAQVKGVKVLKRLESGRKLCYTVEGYVEPFEMQIAIKDYLSGRSAEVQLQGNGWIKIVGLGVREETEEEFYKSLGLSPSKYPSGKIYRYLIIKVQFLKHAKAIQVEEENISIVATIFGKDILELWGEKRDTKKYVKRFASDYHFKILVTFFNKNGIAIKREGNYIEAEKKDEAVPGEEDYLTFIIPDDAVSWKVWVPK